MTSQLTQEEKRHVPQVHLLARLDCECRHILGHALRGEIRNSLGDLCAVLIKLRLPEETREHRAAQLRENADVGSPCTLVSYQRGTLCVDTHLSLLKC